jgi:NTP pyrophosphatase (non-canonical NTP hydrolase)
MNMHNKIRTLDADLCARVVMLARATDIAPRWRQAEAAAYGLSEEVGELIEAMNRRESGVWVGSPAAGAAQAQAAVEAELGDVCWYVCRVLDLAQLTDQTHALAYLMVPESTPGPVSGVWAGLGPAIEAARGSSTGSPWLMDALAEVQGASKRAARGDAGAADRQARALGALLWRCQCAAGVQDMGPIADALEARLRSRFARGVIVGSGGGR